MEALRASAVYSLKQLAVKNVIKKLFVMIAILLLSLPASFVITILLFPLWKWVEKDLGIESVGHSGPAEWCYLSVYILIVSGLTVMYFYIRKKREKMIRDERT